MKQTEFCQHNPSSTAEIQQLCVSVVPIFNHLEHHELVEIVKTTHQRTYTKGELVFQAGESDDRLHIVHRGRLKIYRLSNTGKEHLVRFLTPGDFIGELALFSESVHEDYAEAQEKTEVCTMKRADLQTFLFKYPSISLRILSQLTARLGQAEKQATSFSTETVDTRIALYIADLTEQFRSLEVRLPMTKRDLASYLGTSPETVSRKLAEFEETGLISQNGRHIQVLDLDELLLV